MNRLLATSGTGHFYETEYSVPELTPNEICVRAVMTGVCRSDIDMMQGTFGPLPLNMQGHEGLGKVIGIGANIADVKLGDFVATRGEPAYADIYNVRKDEYVFVPEAHPRYIIEPVACGINIVNQPITEIKQRQGNASRLLILGSGFLAWVAYHRLLAIGVDFEITVVGNSNKELWKDVLVQDHHGCFDVIIDLSSKDDIFTMPIVNEEALVIFGAQKTITTDFGTLLWKACTMVFPSPRTSGFYQCMKDAVWMIENGHLDVDSFWTKAYNRNTEWQQAFADGVDRPSGYSRGYIKWD